MLDQIRAFFVRLLPQNVRRALPLGDRRRGAQWGMVAVGVFMIQLGKFAVFSPIDTLFSQNLARIGLETEWGVIMISVGLLQIVAAFVPWRTALVLCYGLSGLVMCWTYVIVGLAGKLSTPTVDACLGVGIVMLIAAVSKARQSVCIRSYQKATNYGYARD